MSYETFKEKWEELDLDQKICLHNKFLEYVNWEGYIYPFDNDFWEFYNTKEEAARAAVFGKITWCDDYVRFNGYGNPETMCHWEVEKFMEDYLIDIIERKDVWEEFIDED